MTLEKLKAQMDKAVAEFQKTGDMTAIQAASKATDKAKAEIAKEQAVKLGVEAAALAGKREELEKKVFAAVQTLGLDKEIKSMKVKGFNYFIDCDYELAGEQVHNVANVGLIHFQAPKVKKAGGGGTGKSKDEYGLSLLEIVDKYGTDAEKAAIAATESNSKSWQLKVAVKKAAIAAGKLAPVK